MNRLTIEIDKCVLKATEGMSGFATNDLIRLNIKNWPDVDSLKDPSNESIGRAMSRLGFDRWRNGMQRGWFIELKQKK